MRVFPVAFSLDIASCVLASRTHCIGPSIDVLGSPELRGEMLWTNIMRTLKSYIHLGVLATFRTLPAICIGLWFTGSASGASIGLKLGMNGNGGLQNTNVGALQPGDTAGAPGYQQSNWNVLGRYGDSSNNAFPITDSSGAAANIVVHWDATGNYSQSGAANPAAQTTPDGNLMNGYDDSNGNGNVALTNGLSLYAQNGNNKPMVYISGLQAWLATQGVSYYDVVVYSDGDVATGRGGEYWLVDATGATSSLTFSNDLTTHAFICDRANFVTTGTYAEVPVTVNNGRESQQGNFQGNYVVFPSLTNDSFLLRTAEFNSRSPINAVQIIPRPTALPAVIDPLLPATVYSGAKAVFRARAAGVRPMSFRWQKGGADLTDGANISGAQTATLTINPVSAADIGSYAIVVSNSIGTITSPAVDLAVISPAANSYAEKIFTNHPVAYWRFNDQSDPFNNPYAVAADAVGGFSGTYGSASPNAYYGTVGPRPSAFPGFEANNGAFASTYNTAHTWVTAPPLNIATNAVTMMCWIYPTLYSEPGSAGLIFCRTGNNDINGLDYQNNNQLGYTWNNLSTTYNFASGLIIPSNMWSFVALVLEPTNATLYLYNANGQLSATNILATHTNALFSGPTLIGCDPSSTTTPANRAFGGSIDEAAVFNYAMSPLEVYNIYKKGLGLNYIPASIIAQPKSAALYTGRTATFTAAATGDKPLSYRWRKNGGDLFDGPNISGATTPTLTISNVTAGDIAAYTLYTVNLAGNATSDPAQLTVVDPPSPMTAYETSLQTLNPAAYWRFNETSGSVYAYDYWGGNIATNEMVRPSEAGPTPPDFPGFEAANSAATYSVAFGADTDTRVEYMNNLPAFSIAGWFKMSQTQIPRVGLFGQNDVAEFGFHGADASGLAQLGIWTPRGAAYLPQGLVTLDQWCFTAAVGDTNGISLYLFTTNGSGGALISQSVGTLSSGTNFGSSLYSFKIGGGGILDATANFFNGNIDEVAFFKRALSQNELVSLFATGLGVTSFAPQITGNPASPVTLYAGRTLTLSARAVGSAPLSYQWRTNGVPVTDVGNISGSTTPTLVITNVGPANAGDYDLVVTNTSGWATSTVARVSVVVPRPGYDAAVVALKPLAYYRLNETGGTIANEYSGGFNGTYNAGVTLGVAGPRNPPFLGLETTNVGIQVITNLAGSYVTAPFGSLGLNTVTMTAWVYPVGDMDPYAGIIVSRGGTAGGGFGYTGGQIGYTWNGNSANTYNFRSGLVPPLNQWSFVALVVTPTNAIVYMSNTSGQASATNVLAHTADVFGTWFIGRDNNSNADDGTRNFNGMIDEVAIFNYSLSPSQIQQLYTVAATGPQVTLSYQRSGNNVILTWPAGTLLQATEATAPAASWTPVPGNPVGTYTVTPDQSRMFFKVRVQ